MIDAAGNNDVLIQEIVGLFKKHFPGKRNKQQKREVFDSQWLTQVECVESVAGKGKITKVIDIVISLCQHLPKKIIIVK
ncbi:hypothetical protein AB4Z45_01385 [Paenibacillus sp. MCAF9]